ncbi:MAG: hypothetical protein IPM26_15270 [Saprospiraceae bacterium]|nr:hypothetical protein [Saprospiraceae bacterium]
MTKNPFQITFALRQHTPIIHFQHEQEGATLRATELKPKLDLFIIKKCLRELTPAVVFSHDDDARKKFKTIACNENNDLGHHKPGWKTGWWEKAKVSM